MSGNSNESLDFPQDNKTEEPAPFVGSTSESYSEKDKLMEQYEEKMGELLHCQQEICDLKNQNAALLQKAKEANIYYKNSIQEYEQQLTELQEKYNSVLNSTRQSVIPTGSPEVDKWKQRCVELETTLREKERIIQRKDAELEEYNESSASMNSERSEYAARCSKQQMEINELKVKLREVDQLKRRIEDLEKANSELIDGNTQLHSTIVTLEQQINEKSTESRAIKERINEKSELANTLSTKIHDINEKMQTTEQELFTVRKSLQLKNESLAKKEEEVKKLRIDNKKLGDIGKKLQEKVISLDAKLKNLIDVAPNIGTYNELVDFIHQIPKEQKERRKTMREMKRDIRRLSERAEIADKLETENAQMREEVAKLRKLRLICKSYSDIDQKMVDRMNEFVGIQKPSLRNIIVMTVMLKRWQRSTGKIDWRDDTLNWWWIAPCGDNKTLEGITKIIDDYHQLLDDNASLAKEIETLNSDLQKTKELESKSENEKYARRLLLQQISELNDEIASMVSKEEYERKSQKLHEQKQELKKALTTISELQKENYSNAEELGQLRIEIKQKDEEIEQYKRELDDCKEEIDDLNSHVKLMQKFNSSKRKEFLSMERGFMKNETDKIRNDIEFRALVTENEQLYRQIHYKGRKGRNENEDNSNVIRTLI